MTLAIRVTEPRDRERLTELFQALNRHEDTVSGDRRTDRAGAEDSLRVSEELVKSRNGVFLVAEVDDRVVGLLTLIFKEGPIYLLPEARAYAHIADLVVDEDHRRSGIGAALMTAAEQRAADLGYRQISIGVLAGNSAAEAAYARQGFRVTGLELFKEIGARDEEPH